MAVMLHGLSSRSLRGALILATAVGAAAAALLRGRLGYELMVAVAWDLAVLSFIVTMVVVTSRFSAAQMAKKVLHRAPSSFLVGGTALSSALFGIYAIVLLLSASGDSEPLKALHLVVALLTTLLSWALVHLLFALEYAKLFYLPHAEGDSPPGGLDFPGKEPPDYADFLYFSFIIGVACQTADVSISGGTMRRRALLHGLIAFLFNTVILAATINVAAGLG